MPTTPNFEWETPVPDGSAGTWDDILNALAVAVDGDLNTVKTTADGALPKSGGTMTGKLAGLASTWTTVDKGSMNGAVELDLSAGNYFFGVKAGAVTLTFANWPASGRVQYVMLEVDNDSASSITFPAAVKWDTLTTAPANHATDLQCFVFWSSDNGTTIRGALVYQRST